MIAYLIGIEYNEVLDNNMRRLLLLLSVICSVWCEEWYMHESHLINEAEFNVMIQQRGFKIVKYFLPLCKYCRLLKEVFDELKKEQVWHFTTYDMNCEWYPAFCHSQGVPGSFPYVIVYDQKGAQYTQIHGYYPMPVLREILLGIQREALSTKGLQQEAILHANSQHQLHQHQQSIIELTPFQHHSVKEQTIILPIKQEIIILQPIKEQKIPPIKQQKVVQPIKQQKVVQPIKQQKVVQPIKQQKSTPFPTTFNQINKQLQQINNAQKLQQPLPMMNIDQTNTVQAHQQKSVMKSIFNVCCIGLSIAYLSSFCINKTDIEEKIPFFAQQRNKNSKQEINNQEQNKENQTKISKQGNEHMELIDQQL